MPAVSGVAFLVRVNTGTAAAPVWTTVAGQRGATLNRNNDPIDVRSKDDAFWPNQLPGQRNWSIDFEGLLIEGDAGLRALETAYHSNTRVQADLITPTSVRYQGFAILTDFSYEAPHDAEATASGTLEGASVLTRI